MKSKVILTALTILSIIGFIVSLNVDMEITTHILCGSLTLGGAINFGIFALAEFVE